MNSFLRNLAVHRLQLTRERATTLQVNVGRLCNLACRHCHVDAGPARNEVMDRQTMEAVIDFARRNSFAVIDITGGAPELVPGIAYLLDQAAALAPTVMMRSNLLALAERSADNIPELCRRRKITIVASFPSTNRGQTEAQRGSGVWEKSIAMRKKLNEAGYGVPGTGLNLFLVSNPAGAFLPVDQCAAEKKFRADLARKWGIRFTGLFTFANMPLGRFKIWLEQSGNYAPYMEKLAASFNPATVAGLMCRSLINVSWDGCLYDCDFNMAAGLPYSGSPVHISEVPEAGEGIPVATGDHCLACTAGAGFT
ncbi:MAG TPA: radical SAM/Cys-rich domain protein [Desulfobacteraceae bacterium]|nr:radical SAM/Cys-rich domain protein [Desulfobacteraceae bacterium]